MPRTGSRLKQLNQDNDRATRQQWRPMARARLCDHGRSVMRLLLVSGRRYGAQVRRATCARGAHGAGRPWRRERA
jgi:hypothetical protein